MKNKKSVRYTKICDNTIRKSKWMKNVTFRIISTSEGEGK